jgi:hypothetical protein
MVRCETAVVHMLVQASMMVVVVEQKQVVTGAYH